MFNAFSMSGEHMRFETPLVPRFEQQQSVEAPDESGQVFDRCHDAELELLIDFWQS